MSMIYKPGQGRHARIAMGVFLALFAGFGCASLKGVLDSTELHMLAKKFIPVGVFLVSVVVIALGLNYPKLANFLIDTEMEMGRVIWPTRREVFASSLVVIVALVVMAAFLYGADQVLLSLLKAVKLY